MRRAHLRNTIALGAIATTLAGCVPPQARIGTGGGWWWNAIVAMSFLLLVASFFLGRKR